MKLPEFKAILSSVSAKQPMGDKPSSGTKQTVLLKIPKRTIDDGYGGTTEIREENYEADVINGKVSDSLLASLVGKKVIVTQAYLNGYDYKEKETGAVKYGKSITVNSLKEFV